MFSSFSIVPTSTAVGSTSSAVRDFSQPDPFLSFHLASAEELLVTDALIQLGQVNDAAPDILPTEETEDEEEEEEAEEPQESAVQQASVHARLTNADIKLIAPYLRAQLNLLDRGAIRASEAIANLKERYPQLSPRFNRSFLYKVRRGKILRNATGRDYNTHGGLPELPASSTGIKYNKVWDHPDTIYNVIAGVLDNRDASQIAAQNGIHRGSVYRLMGQITSGKLSRNFSAFCAMNGGFKQVVNDSLKRTSKKSSIKKRKM